MESVTLNATVRDSFGKGAARKLRHDGKLPAVIYRSGGDATHITIDPHELETVFRRTMNRNTLLEINADGTARTCLVKDVQRHPVSQAIRHLDLYEVDKGEHITVRVPVKAVGTAEGVRMGGKLRIIRRDVDVRCRPGDIPSRVEIDVTELTVGGYARVSAATAPEGCEIVYKGDFNLVTVVGKRGAKGAEAEA